MKNLLKLVFDESKHDGLYFTDQIEAFVYKDKSIAKKHELGYKYHIILYNNTTKPEHFKAILTDPVHYIAPLVTQGYYGIISKCTDTSKNFINHILENL